jgi:hypothetical protein
MYHTTEVVEMDLDEHLAEYVEHGLRLVALAYRAGDRSTPAPEHWTPGRYTCVWERDPHNLGTAR